MAAPMFDLRFEVAFATDPDALLPSWVDLSSRVHLPSGITIRRGRGEEFDQAQAGTMQLSLENIDGAFTPDGPAAWANLLPMRRCRLTYRDPATLGQRNILSAEDASFEGGTIGGWSVPVSVSTTLANDNTKADVGTRSLRVTANGAYSAPLAQLAIFGLTIGRTYTARARVWVSAGMPDMRLGVAGAGNGSTISTKGAWATSTITWAATQSSHFLNVGSTGAVTTAGQQLWIDTVMLDEGSTLGTFTTTNAGTAIVPRFDGYVDEWPVEWPDGGQTYSRAQITCSDLLARLGNRKKLRSVVVESAAVYSPTAHFPLGEAEGSTLAASIAGEAAILNLVQYGTGGSVTFGAGTGVPTDGNAAPIFAPANATNGGVLQGRGLTLNLNPALLTATDVSLVANFTTTGTSSTVAAVSDTLGAVLSIDIDATGKIAATITDPTISVATTVTSAITGNDNRTHMASASLDSAGVLRLLVDGNIAATPASTIRSVVPFSIVTVGGMPSGGRLFTGTVSHVVVFPSVVTGSGLADIRTAATTGFAGDTSDRRIDRVLDWIGLPASRRALDVGQATIGHIDSTGLSILEYLRKVETAEGGLLFAGADGRLTLHNRARSYTPRAPDLSLPAQMLGEGTRIAKNLAQVVNDVTGARPGGATVRKVDASSQTTYGQLTDSLDLAVNTDAQVSDAVAWRLNTSRVPLTRFTDLQLDAFTDATYSPQVVTQAGIGSRVQLTGLPSQAPAATMTQQIQGYAETINAAAWSVTANATPVDHLAALILDDATAGLLDANNHLAY